MQIRSLGELGLIKHFARQFKVIDGHIIKGIGDDTAAIAWKKGKTLLFTCDMIIEGVHFTLADATAFEIGWKALAVNISDIAAMGGIPRYAVVSIGVNPSLPERFVKELARGIRDIGRRFGVSIVGGDTNSSDSVVVDCALIGEAEKRSFITRSGARQNDLIMVTGTLGGSHVKRRHLRFVPRLAESRWITRNCRVHSMIDVSDGLALDLSRILASSGVGAAVYQNAIPVSPDARSFDEAIAQGEDFELLFTASPQETARLFRRYVRSKIRTPITIIGHIQPKRKGYVLVGPEGKVTPLVPKGYTHF